MPDRLPPLTALRAFDAAARHMSFAKAAEELFVTPAALSYQIKQLEEHFAVELFRRLNRAVELTDAGLALQPEVAEGFEALRAGARAVERLKDDKGLTVTAGPAFTAKWFSPRFFRFAEKHPEIELRFVATLRMMDFRRDGVDAAIRFGRGDTTGLYVEDLFDEWATPVCAPELAEKIERPEDLADLPIFHDELTHTLTNPPDWRAWFGAAGAPDAWHRGTRFSNPDHAIDAALEGGGVAIGRISLTERYLTNRRLVTPFDLAIRAGDKYRFVCPEGSEQSPQIATFLAWMRYELKAIEPIASRMRIVDPPLRSAE